MHVLFQPSLNLTLATNKHGAMRVCIGLETKCVNAQVGMGKLRPRDRAEPETWISMRVAEQLRVSLRRDEAIT